MAVEGSPRCLLHTHRPTHERPILNQPYGLAPLQSGNEGRNRSVKEGFPVVLLAEEAARCRFSCSAGTDTCAPGWETRAVEDPVTSTFAYLGAG